jgi:two-component system cell cycle sensor histidine kinase/response regulator CckA
MDTLHGLLVAHAPNALVVFDADLGRFVEANPLACELLGFSRDELLTMHPNDLTEPASLAALQGREPLRAALAGEPQQFRVIKRRKDGSSFPCEVRLVPIAAPGRLVAGSLLDLSAQEAAEEVLRESVGQLRALLRLAFHGTFTHADGRIVQADPEVEALLGHPPGSLLGRDCFELLAEEDHERVGLHLHSPSSEPVRVTLIRADGGRVQAESVGAACRFEGRLARIVGLRDVRLHQLEEADAAEHESARLHRQRLEGLGALAGDIAHDFNNLLVQVLANLELLEVPDQKAAQEARRAARRAADLTRQLLAYSGKGRFVVERAAISDLVRSMASLTAEVVPRGVELRFDLARDLPAVGLDRTQLEQLVVALVGNAAEACGQGASICVATGLGELEPSRLARAWLGAVLKPGPGVWLEVRDEGEGMAPSVRARMFEPYYSTRPGHSGLGLAAVMGIVRGHGGAIEVTSNEGLGTTVRIWFPQASDESAPAGVGRVPAEGRRILVVDDEAGVRSVARRCLRRGGYEVIEARDGLEALDVFEEHENIDLVLLDLTMPRLDGMKTLSRLRARQPDLRVVLSSGFSEHEVTEQLGLLQQQALFLPKPWTWEELLGVVGRALSEPRA